MISAIALATTIGRAATQDPGTMLDQAMRAVVQGSREATAKTEVGFRPGICVLGAYVRAGDTVKFGSTFEGDRTYVVTAGGNDSAEDIDVAVVDAEGNVLGEDDTDDAYAVATVETKATTKVNYVVTNAGDKPALVCVAVMVSKGGWDIHDDNVKGILDRCAEINRLSRKEGYRFYAAKGTWCLYGGMVEQGKSIKAVQVGLAKGRHSVLGFGDGEAKELSLKVTDKAGQVVGESKDGDDLPAFDFPAAYTGQTNIELKNVKGRPSFAMFTLFERS